MSLVIPAHTKLPLKALDRRRKRLNLLQVRRNSVPSPLLPPRKVLPVVVIPLASNIKNHGIDCRSASENLARAADSGAVVELGVGDDVDVPPVWDLGLLGDVHGGNEDVFELFFFGEEGTGFDDEDSDWEVLALRKGLDGEENLPLGSSESLFATTKPDGPPPTIT